MYKNRSVELANFFILLVLVIFLIYSNTLHSPWILDDQGNILENPFIHLQHFSLQTLTNTFYAYPGSPGTLYRPVACLSFALNWFVGQDNPFSYHIVNISIHILTAFFLYLSCLYLIQLSVPVDVFSRHGQLIASFAALLWAMNPMQTQAVTYIVQRMAALAAMFYVIGIFFFLKARLASFVQHRLIFSLCCLFSFFLALSSKENAIIFPCSLILIECVFFKNHRKILRHDKYKIFFFSFFLSVVILGSDNLISTLNHEHRTFTLTQHILTSPRILIFYLSQIFFPISSRFSIEHDFILSTSLFSPLTTIPSILFCILLIIFSFTYRETRRLFSFSILFYFLNHAVESTILNLELFFEHRNYLPSLFLFLPIAEWYASLIDIKKGFHARLMLIASSIILLVFFGVNTFDRNQMWSSAVILWQDAHKKAPNSNRAAINLAKEYIQTGDIEAALLLSEQSYYLLHPTKNYSQALSLNGQGVISYIKGNYEKASQLFQQSLRFVPDYGEAKKNLILTLCKQYRFQEALAQFLHYTNHRLEGIILLWLKQPEKALEKFRAAPQIMEVENMTGIGKALSMIGDYEQANFYLRQTASFSSFNNLIYIENLLRADRMKDAKNACEKMFSFYSALSIFQSLFNEDTHRTPLDRKLVAPFVLQQAEQIIMPPLAEMTK